MSESAAAHDAEASWNDLARRVCDRQAETLDGTLAPGVTCFASSERLSGTLTLDAGDGTDAFWIIRVPVTLTVDADSIVRMTGGGHFGNVYWQVGESATLGVNATFLGNVLARTNITLGHAATVSGRLLAQQSVSLEKNLVTLCCGPLTMTPTVASGVVGHAYETTLTPQGAMFTFMSGAPPPGLTLLSAGVLSGTPTAAGLSTFTLMATDAHDCAGLRQYPLMVRASGPEISALSRPMLLLLWIACAWIGSFYARNA